MYEALHGVKKGLKDIVAPQGMFEDLGLKYVGPIDGHDIARDGGGAAPGPAFGGPVIVHVRDPEGLRATAAAEQDEADQFHAVGAIDPETGQPLPVGTSWTDVFADEMVRIGDERPGRGRRSPRRCCTRSAWTRSPRRTRTGSSTSASPSSTR